MRRLNRRTKVLVASPLAVLACVTGAASGAVLTDSFNTQFDYSGGAVQGIWSGSYNTTGLTNGVVAASPSFADNGLLVIGYDDNLGWEGGRSTAPFLFVDVPANNDFVAEVTIQEQTSGFWSDAGIIARAKQGTPPGPAPDNDDENFTFFGSFRTNDANGDAGTTLHKRIEGGAQVQDSNIAILDPEDEPLPLRLRLEKSGADYIGSVSVDGGATWQVQSTATAAAGTPLAAGMDPIEVGLSFSSFDPALMGAAKFDDFRLEYYPIPEPGAGSMVAFLLGSLALRVRRRE